MQEIFMTINSTAFQILGFEIKWYALIIAFGAYLGYKVFQAQANRIYINEDDQLDIMFWSILVGLMGARIYYVIFNLDYYLQYPIEIINIRGGGMAIYGGVIAGLLTILTICRKKSLPFMQILDAAAPGLLLAQAIGRWGNFINQEAHGEAVSRAFLEKLYLPEWIIEQMYIEGHYYQPTFLYESLWNLIGVGWMMIVGRRVDSSNNAICVPIYLIWYGLGRALIEGMRTDSLYLGSIRISQLVSIMMIVVGLILILRQKIKKIQ